jgi:hypothetical protein
MWCENESRQKKGEILIKEQLRKKKEPTEEFLDRIQREVRKSLKTESLRHLIKPEFSHIDPDFAFRAPKDEKVIFTQDINLDKKKLKTKLDVKLGRTRKLTQVTKEISYDKWKIRYTYNAQKESHTFKGDAKIAGFEANVKIDSRQKSEFSASRPIKLTESIKVVPSAIYSVENKNMRVGFTGNVNKYFTAAVYVNRSPSVRNLEYSFKGSIHNFVDIRLHGRTVCRPKNPRSITNVHNGTLIKKIGKYVSVRAGLQYENSTITNPSFSFVYSRKF